jgi:transposase
VNCAKGLVKSSGGRLPSCSTASFHKQVPGAVPEELKPAIDPMIETIAHLTHQIRHFDRSIAQLGEQSYPETRLLRQVRGVGSLTALTFLLVLEESAKFRKSRTVGAFLGLTPRQDDSGACQKQLRITKSGDTLLRRLLVGSAAYILGPFGTDCDLRRKGERLAERGGKNAKKRATVAVARQLAVLLHSLWKTGEVYEPLRNSTPSAA